MKSQRIIFIFFIIWSFSSYAQEQTIQLKLREGHEYVFEKVDKVFAVNENGDKNERSVKKKKISFIVEKVTDDGFVELSLKHLVNYHDEQIAPGVPRIFPDVVNFTNHFFPPINEGETQYPDPKEFIEPLLCRSVLHFSINLKTNRIELRNRAELFEDFMSRLEEQGYDKEIIKGYISFINKKKFFVEEDLISFLTWFNHARLTSDKSIQNSKLEGKYIVHERHGNFLNFGDQDVEDFIPGKKYKKYWINLESGLITHYTRFRRDSIKSDYERRINKNLWEVHETDFHLLYKQPIPVNKLFLSGKIENPLSNKMYIKFLDQPFGTDLKNITVFLNDEGSFSTSIDISKRGLIYIENENPNRNRPNEKMVMYAEPGDTLQFIAGGEERPWNLSFKKDRISESRLILELREKIKLRDAGVISDRFNNQILDRDLYFGANVSSRLKGNSFITLYGDYYIDFFKVLENINDISLKYKDSLTFESYSFITNEFKAFFYNGIFNLLLSAQNMQDYNLHNYFNMFTKSEISNIEKISEKAEKFDIYSIYNDYGLQSRKYVNTYLAYQYQKTRKVDNRLMRIVPGFHWFIDVDQFTQFARMILNGAPLYREIGANLYQILTDNSNTVPRMIYSDFQKEAAIRYLKLMEKCCNDMEFGDKISYLLNQETKMGLGNYIPNLKLLDIDKKVLSYADVVKDKPTIFYFPSTWIGERYELDVIAPKNPEIRIVMVTEGSNFREWKEYNEKAEPVIKQLFYKNDSTSLKELMLQQNVYAVFDSKGNFINYYSSFKKASDAAKDSLVNKKQLDKSQLKIIISILLVSLLTLFIIMLYWKWRVRQRFRKEEQKRRLRELELTAIRSQMNPHFLFNSLNSVQNLVQQNKGREAHLYLADFAGLIRKVLQNSEKEEVSLAEELEMVQQYLSLEKLRFDFDYSVFTDENIDANNTMVPSMLLQPFAENAVIHGLQNKTGNRQLKIEVTREETGIKISIEDNGIGREAAKAISKTKNGKGSKLMKERLEILQQKQGENYRLEIIDLKGEETRTRVEIFIPEEN